jgi:hypothetical protein
VGLGAVHPRLTFRGEQWPYYFLALADGQVFLFFRRPDLYDRNAQPIPMVKSCPVPVSVSSLAAPFRADVLRATLVKL